MSANQRCSGRLFYSDNTDGTAFKGKKLLIRILLDAIQLRAMGQKEIQARGSGKPVTKVSIFGRWGFRYTTKYW